LKEAAYQQAWMNPHRGTQQNLTTAILENNILLKARLQVYSLHLGNEDYRSNITDDTKDSDGNATESGNNTTERY